MNIQFLFHLLTFFAIPLGLASQLLELNFLMQSAKVISELFLRFFKLISVPIIFFSLSCSISKMQNLGQMKRIGGKIAFYTFGTTLIAASISLSLYLLIQPVTMQESQAFNIVQSEKSYWYFLLQCIPDNFLQAFLDNNLIGVAFLASIVGLCSLQLESPDRKILQDLFSAIFHLILKVTEYLLFMMPFGVWAFSYLFLDEIRTENQNIQKLGSYCLCVVGSNLLQGAIVLPLLLRTKGISVFKLFKAMLPALLTGFFSKSSNAALPLAIQCGHQRAGLREKIVQVSFPICSVINMNACASFILSTVLFVSASHGIHFSSLELTFWVFMATFAAIGNAGVPMGCYFLSSSFLVGMGVPLNLLGLILPVYTLFDMLETAINLWSDATITAIVDKETKDEPLNFTEAS